MCVRELFSLDREKLEEEAASSGLGLKKIRMWTRDDWRLGRFLGKVGIYWDCPPVSGCFSGSRDEEPGGHRDGSVVKNICHSLRVPEFSP